MVFDLPLGERLFSGEVEEPLSWVLAIIALSFAFGGLSVFNLSFLLSPYFIGVFLGFALHELAHRGIARMYGMHASFIAFIPGLIITFISGFLPFAIIAPGYVRVFPLGGWVWDRNSILYSIAAGPAANIILSLVSLLLLNMTNLHSFKVIAFINSWIAFFNLLPIPPLDGSKIFNLNFTLWTLMILLSLVLLMVSGWL